MQREKNPHLENYIIFDDAQILTHKWEQRSVVKQGGGLTII